MDNVKVQEYETLTDWLRARATVITTPVAEQLRKWGVHPNTVTMLALPFVGVAAAVLALGHVRLGGALLLLASSFDAFDGALARLVGTKSRFGAFLDSTFDRLSEGLFLFGALVYLLSLGHILEVYLVFAAMLGSVMVSYTRARAEGLGYACKVGMLTRVGRVLLLGGGLFLGLIRPTLLLLAIFSWVTVIQRIAFVYRVSREDP